MTEIKGARTTVIQINADQFNQLLSEFRDLKSEVKKLRAAVDDYPRLGTWITAQEALKLLPIKNSRTLSKWVERGVIRSKNIVENGNKKGYSKADVLAFAVNAEKYLKGH